MLLIIMLLALLLALVAYVGYILLKKDINPKEIRLHSVKDVKKLLTRPSTAGPERYLAKRA